MTTDNRFKLSEEDVRFIRTCGLPTKEIVERFGVSESHIQRILLNEARSEFPPPLVRHHKWQHKPKEYANIPLVANVPGMPDCLRDEFRMLAISESRRLEFHFPDNDETALRIAVRETLKRLPWREKEIIELRFGLKDGSFYTYKELANIFSVTIERIRQIEFRAIKRIRHHTALPIHKFSPGSKTQVHTL